MKKLGYLVLSLLIVASLSSLSCTSQPQTQSPDEEAREIYGSLMCPLCPGQTIGQSQSKLSLQMRTLVLEKLEQGETREEILQFFVERYGESVLAAPSKSGFNLIVWVVPFIGILAGSIILWIFIGRRVKDKNRFSDGLLSRDTADSYDEKYYSQLEKDLEDFDERGFR